MYGRSSRQYRCAQFFACLLFALTIARLSPEPVVSADDAQNPSADYAEIYRRVSPSVVSIEVEIGFFDEASGTGFAVDNKGHIITNAHVVEDATDIRVIFTDESELRAELIGIDRLADIAVIKVDAGTGRLQPITYGDSDDLAIGQSVLAIGNPLGLEATLTTGIISGLNRKLELSDGSIMEGMIQTDAALAAGSSGGPLLNLAGEVVGVNSASYGGRFVVSNFGFAIPSNAAKRISERMITSGMISRFADVAQSILTAIYRLVAAIRSTATAEPTAKPIFIELTITDMPIPIDTNTPTTVEPAARPIDEQTVTPTPPELCRAVVLGQNGINLRWRPKPSSEQVARIPPATIVPIVQQQREEGTVNGPIWYYVRIRIVDSELTGWIRNDTVTPITGSECPALPISNYQE